MEVAAKLLGKTTMEVTKELLGKKNVEVLKLLGSKVEDLHEVQNEVESLTKKLKDINSTLKKADIMIDREEEEEEDGFHEWVSQLRNLAFRAEDVIELFNNIATPYDRYRYDFQLVKEVFGQVLTLHKLRNEIDDINIKLGMLSEKSSPEVGETSIPYSNRANQIVGFETETEKLVSLLIKEEPQGRLLVVPIWAPGGAGKTALARHIYKRSDVNSHFDCVAWVSVSPDCVLRNIWQSILEQVQKVTKEEKKEYLHSQTKEDIPTLWGSMIYNYLKGKNYLIVVDDLWNQNDWETIKKAFPTSPKKKCRVLLTTRIGDVARCASPLNDPFKLRILNKDESLKLFLKVIYRCSLGEIPSLSKEMEDLARQLLSKCDGLPLAIVLLGGALTGKNKDINEWCHMLEQVQNSCLVTKSRVFRKVFSQSYNDMPCHLRSCFLYFGLFPEDSEIQCDRLIRLWVAEGFSEQRSSDNGTMEVMAREYLKDLIQRSLIQVEKWKLNGDPQTCRINGLVRKLAEKEAKKDKFSSISKEKHLRTWEEGSRRIALHHSKSSTTAPLDSKSMPTLQRTTSIPPPPPPPPPPVLPPPNYISVSHLLSFLKSPLKFPNHVYSLLCFSKHPQICYKQFHLLRVLDLQGAEEIDKLPDEISHLTLLRYLNLRGTRVKEIPTWIANLCNLQTLDTPESKIPIETLKLNLLRHLFADSFDSSPPNSSSSSSSSLLSLCNGFPEHLQTLELDIGNWVTSGLHELSNLRVLRLRLHGLKDIESKQWEIILKAIANSTHLRVFSLTQGERSNSFPIYLPSFSSHWHLYEIVVEGKITKLPKLNDFPPHLTYLWLESYMNGVIDPLFTLQKLNCLKKLCLRLFKGESDGRMIFSAGGFPRLEYLYIRVHFKLRNWIVKEGAMPCLRDLHIEGEDKLGKLPDGLKHITSLKNIFITKGYDVRESLMRRGQEWQKVKDLRLDDIHYSDESYIRP
ncbi:disease resistance RPP8-like protein 3 [Macadamia integrifolia]|uniref:disease resistance RPP8-like protein 3 n=1 Tax=Macadamia integrifolia TaxID=60698 RepID=UPI001C4F437C|nr:disease resistance RPP8-like protein 3 [Macadamia integrifolia]